MDTNPENYFTSAPKEPALEPVNVGGTPEAGQGRPPEVLNVSSSVPNNLPPGETTAGSTGVLPIPPFGSQVPSSPTLLPLAQPAKVKQAVKRTADTTTPANSVLTIKPKIIKFSTKGELGSWREKLCVRSKKKKFSDSRKACNEILNELFSNKNWNCAHPFYELVNVKQLGLDDYHNIIEKPMDLNTVKKKMKNREYKTAREFADDVQLIFTNCYAYYSSDHEIVRMGKMLQDIFEARFACILNIDEPLRESKGTDSSSSGSTSSFKETTTKCNLTLEQELKTIQRKMKRMKVKDSVPIGAGDLNMSSGLPVDEGAGFSGNHSPGVTKATNVEPKGKTRTPKKSASSNLASKRLKMTSSKTNQVPYDSSEDENDDKPISSDELRQLDIDIDKLSNDKLKRIPLIIREPSFKDSHFNEIKIDFKNLKPSKFRKVQKYVASCLRRKVPKKGTSGPSRLSEANSSSNSSK